MGTPRGFSFILCSDFALSAAQTHQNLANFFGLGKNCNIANNFEGKHFRKLKVEKITIILAWADVRISKTVIALLFGYPNFSIFT